MSEKVLIKQFYYKNRFNYGMSILVSILGMVFNIAGAFLLKELTDVASSGNMKDLVNILYFCFFYVIALGVILLLKRTFLNNYIYKAIKQYKNYCFDKLIKINRNTFNNEITGKYISIFTNDINSVETSYVRGNFVIISQVISFVGAIATMAFLNWILTIAVLAISLLPILVSILFGKALAVREKETSDKNEGFVGLVKDLLSGFSVIKSFKAEKKVLELFFDKNSVIEQTKNHKRKTADFIELLSALSSFLVEVVTFGLGAYLAIRGIISAGTVIAFIQLLNYVLGPVGSLGPLLAGRNAARTLIHKMADTIVMEEKNEKNESKIYFKREIRLENVSFGYEDTNILKQISINFEKGKSYVIVGASGSGKSTLVNLILGYYNNYKGKIVMDDTDLQVIQEDNLCDIFSVIQQNVFIFDNTIENNITMFQEFPKDIIEEAIEKSGLSKLILEKGIDYHCGENGCYLSGGEKQRISIARSLVRKAPVLVMDEATSALDPATAVMIEKEISNLEGITRIVISHKLEEAILKSYDEIVVMNGGKIVQKGSFDVLTNEGGYFASLYQVARG